MNTAKLKILEETFKNKFDIQRFKKFTREFFNEPEMLPETRRIGIWREYEEHVAAYYTIAKYTDSEDNSMIIMAVELKKDRSVERARSMQRNFISKVLDENGLEAAIVAFYSEDEPSWRLSFVRLDYSFTDKGIELDLTPARRFSYLVGENEPNHTAQSQLLTIFEDDTKNPTLEEIEESFSVEKVTKDFFNQYKDKYLDLKEHLEKNEAFKAETKKLGFEVNKFAEQFAKKLMGQLAFLYFLQKKGWLGVRIMPEDHSFTVEEFKEIYSNQDEVHKTVLEKAFRRNIDGNMKMSSQGLFNLSEHEAELLSDCFVGTKYDMPWGSGNRTFIRGIFDFCIENTNNNFFNDYLEPFFYEALNKRRKHHYFKRFNCKIPFLNGGLFEPIEGYHWRDVDFEIPNEIFSNEKEKGRDADGILDIFDRFNFTMNESEPLEKEVAVDPEMLGKIFENLLDVSDRKSKGAFYTPREIVHYMCQESLINYLVNEVEVPYDDIKEFILYGEIIRDADNRRNVGYSKEFTIKQSIFDNIVKIDKALENVKIADPAVGSGAFPLGMINEIVRARNNITEYIIRKDNERYFDRKYGEEFIRKWRSPYKMKWDTIKNSIFAVDIEPSAVDITKLRLWLSVVVDQEIDEENPEPHPLPNLDCNIMVGNSLIDEYEGIQLFDKSVLTRQNDKNNGTNNIVDKSMQLSMLVDHTDEVLKEMFDLQDRYFDEDNEDNKRELKKKIDDIRDDLIRYKLEKDGNTEGLRRYEESLKNKTKPYFIWELEFAKVFKDNGGFDIVIGNPPYVGEKGNKDLFRPIAKTEFGKKYYQGKMDLFYFFFHKSINIAKENGIISFITTNYYITADSAIKLRKDFEERAIIINLINFYEMKIFETALGQHNMITILRKNTNKLNIKARMCVTNREGVANPSVFYKIFNWQDTKTKYYEKEQCDIYDTENRYIVINDSNNNKTITGRILSKIKDNSYRLREKCTINTGVNTGCDKVTNSNYRKVYGNLKLDKDINIGDGIFVINQLELDKLRLEDYEKKMIYKFYKSSSIGKYIAPIKWDNEYLIYINKDTDIEKYPNILKHLAKFRGFTELKREYLNGKLPWYSLHWAREKEIFTSSDKIVLPYRNEKNIFAFCDENFFGSKDVLYIRKNENYINLKYLLALLNSKLYYFWLWYKGKKKGKILELYVTPISEIPIKMLTSEQENILVEKVEELLYIFKNNNTTRKNERESRANIIQNEIDSLIYEFYGLSHDEKKVVEDLYKANIGI